MSLEPGRRWWSRRWLEALEGAGAAAARSVQRGQALARRGAVEQLRIEAGRATGVVVDEQPRVQRVELRWPVPAEPAWQAAIGALSNELRFTAELLEGSLPEEAEQVLAEAGVELVAHLDTVELVCGCRERPRPCRHAAALWTAVTAVLDRDVFALLRLRGRERAEILDALRLERGGDTADGPGARLDLTQGLYAARGDLDAIELHPTPVHDPAAVLRSLGPPPGVDDPAPLERAVERAAATAWRLAAGEGADAADEELLLAELRAQRVATPGSLSEALGRDPDRVREELDRLFADGVVLRTGSGEQAKYRAADS